jgi:hypothetical protein
MLFSRFTAALTVSLLILCTALIAIGVLLAIRPTLTYGYSATAHDGTTHTVEHSAGVIRNSNPDHSFVLVTASGELQTFQCSQKCLTALGHIQRHINEKAHTDIYFIRESSTVLDAIDVD